MSRLLTFVVAAAVALAPVHSSVGAPSVALVGPDYLVRRGYVMVVVDVRGTGGSEGVWSAFGKREQRDGAEVVEWAHARTRPWSDGRVGMLGPSYLGIGQLSSRRRRATACCRSTWRT